MVLITTGVKDERVKSKILDDLKTPTLDETVKLVEQMNHVKGTNARIEKRDHESKVSSINKSGSGNSQLKLYIKV